MTDEQALFMVRGIVSMAADKAKITTISCLVEPTTVGSRFAFKSSWLNSASGKWQSMAFLADDIKMISSGRLCDLVIDAVDYMKSDIGSEVRPS